MKTRGRLGTFNDRLSKSEFFEILEKVLSLVRKPKIDPLTFDAVFFNLKIFCTFPILLFRKLL